MGYLRRTIISRTVGATCGTLVSLGLEFGVPKLINVIASRLHKEEDENIIDSEAVVVETEEES